MSIIPDRTDFTALVLAPHGRDAKLACMLLADVGITGKTCAGVAELLGRVDDDTCLAVVTEESMRHADLTGLARMLEHQPAWSSLPFVVLTHQGGGPERNPEAARLSELLQNVTFVERPFHATTFASVVRSALRGRLRQFEARDGLERLHQSQETLRTAMLAGRLGTWEYEVGSGEFLASPMVRAIFGRGPDDTLDLADFMAGLHPEDRDAVVAAAGRAVQEHTDYAVLFRSYWPDGSLHWIESHARVVVGDDGALRLIGVSSDVTARKQAEQDQRQINETLELRVAERTRELEQAHAHVLEEIRQREQTETELRQAQKMEAIGQLTGGVAHDFNNLLMAVMGNLDILSKHVADDGRAARLIDGAMQGAQRGAALTQRLLAFARRQDLKVEPRDLIELLRGSEDLLRRSIGDQVELHLDLPQALPFAMVDGNQLDLALLNLVVNARDAMPDGGTIRVSADQADLTETAADLAPGRYLRIAVTDTGQGMDEATLKQATQPFFSTKELGKGTGLGLSMIHGLALQLGGALRLSSAPGQGTRAELWLPVTEAALQAAPADPAPEPARASGPLRILFVDDDALISMSSVELLEDLGHEVTPAYSGAQALDLMRGEAKFDLLITDFSMPKMNGGQLARAARELRPGLPILLATGYADLPAGVEIDLPRLAKPYLQHQLAAEIARLVG